MRLRQGCRGIQWMLAALLADRLTKAMAKNAILPGQLIPGLVSYRSVRNTGMAFSMLSGHAWFLVVLTGLLIAGVVLYLIKATGQPSLLRAGLWLIAGGGLGNLYDRLTLGYVIDFIKLDFVDFAIFNVADMCICVGAALILIGSWRVEREKRRRDGEI